MPSLFPIRVAFPFTPLMRVEGRSLVCLRRIGAMDVARVVISANNEKVRPYIAAGSPLMISWSGNGVKDSFYGYVHSLQPTAKGYDHQMVILAVSAAYPLFNESQRTFYQAGIHNVAEEIADDHRLQLDTDPHLVVLDQILQSDESDWTFLRRLADQWGYVFYVEGVTIVFRPLLKVLEEKIRMVENERTQLTISPNGSNFLEFEPSFTAVGDVAVTTTYTQGTRYVATVIPRQETRPGIFEQIDVERAISTDLESEAVATANEVKQRFPYTARARVMFPAGKKPFDCYRIYHDGDRMVWAIQSVKHMVTGSSYTAEMILGSDGTDAKAGKDALDIGTLLRRSIVGPRSEPTINNFRPYFKGTGGNVLVKDQRWRAKILYHREAAAT